MPVQLVFLVEGWFNKFCVYAFAALQPRIVLLHGVCRSEQLYCKCIHAVMQRLLRIDLAADLAQSLNTGGMWRRIPRSACGCN